MAEEREAGCPSRPGGTAPEERPDRGGRPEPDGSPSGGGSVRVVLAGGAGEGRRVVGRVGESLLELLRREGLPLDAACGGAGNCGRCRVAARGALSSADGTERRLLSGGAEEEGGVARSAPGDVRAEGVPSGEGAFADRLACRCRILGEAEVLLRDASLEARAKLWRADPPGSPPGTEESRGILRGGSVGAFSPGGLGLALDLGTTTLAAGLIDLSDGRRIAASAARNPQASRGADLPARVVAASDPAVLRDLVRALREGVARLIREIAAGEIGRIREAVVAGNPVMTAFLWGCSPEGMARAPFVPPLREGAEGGPEETGLPLPAGARVRLLPGMGGFVGGDATAVLLAMEEVLPPLFPGRARLAIDLGTNGEVLLVRDGRIRVASAAAGPAFEGGRVGCGRPALAGAVRSVRLRGTREEGVPDLEVLGDGPPEGLCGSGLVSLTAALLEEGLLEPSGRLRPAREVPGSPLAGRIVDLPPSAPGRVGSRAFRFRDDPPLLLTQGDLRELQLAKGAVRAATEILMAREGIGPEALESCHLAGAFGAGLDPAEAVRIGLIPALPPERVLSLGPGALLGAEAVLRGGDRAFARARELAAGALHAELEADPDFQGRFLLALSLEGPPLGRSEGVH